MTVERRLQINMAAMSSLATVMLGIRPETSAMIVAMLVVSVSSVLLTDHWGWFRLHRMVANIAMVVAAVVSLNDFFNSGSQNQLLSIAYLLIYVQMILLFQRKSKRIYGQLAVFSFLEVIVAALLNEGLTFGLLLMVYLGLAYYGLSLFFLFRELESLVDFSDVDLSESNPTDDPVLMRQRVVGTPPVSRATAANELVLESIVGWSLAAEVFLLWLTTLVVSAAFFYLTPRSPGGDWQRGGLAAGAVVGFSPDVTLNDMADVLQSDKLVMRVTYSNQLNGEPYTVIGQPYLRGAVLTNYISYGNRARWKPDVTTFSVRTVRPPGEVPQAREIIRQEISLQRNVDDTLFSTMPAFSCSDTPESVRYLPFRGEFVKRGDPKQAEAQFKYTMLTTGFRFGSQIPVYPNVNRLDSAAQRRRWEGTRKFLTYLPSRSRFEGLIKAADNVVATEVVSGGAFETARALEDFFTEPGRFQYSLNLGQWESQRNRKLDPIEDFVVNHRTGHCEYFASALVLMLRSQGIPARLVVGYHGGEYQPIGKYYLVREKHAHAWVEAHLPPDQIPPNTLVPEQIHDGGAWLRLDPTPASAFTEQLGERTVFDQVTSSFDYAQWLWNDYVLRLTPEQQMGGIAQPIANIESLAWVRWAQSRTPKETAKEVSNWLRDRRNWTRGPLLVTLALIALAGMLVYRFGRKRLGGFVWRWPQSSHGSRTATVEFYERFETMMRKAGIKRQPAQTQLEFADMAMAHLAKDSPNQTEDDLCQQLVRLFYCVRFGRRDLTQEDSRRADQLLARIEARLGNPGTTTPHK